MPNVTVGHVICRVAQLVAATWRRVHPCPRGDPVRVNCRWEDATKIQEAFSQGQADIDDTVVQDHGVSLVLGALSMGYLAYV